MSEYKKEECAFFYRTKEKFGELSNFSTELQIRLYGKLFTSSEALYQALRFPYNAELQNKIADAKTPMEAKAIARANYHLTRSDWMDGVRVKTMMFVISTKYDQNRLKMSNVFKETENKKIVEISKNDDFWGAVLKTDGVYVGENVLGNLLTIFRDDVHKYDNYVPNIKDFLLFNRTIDALPF